MVQPLKASTHGRSSSVSEVRVSHRVTRRESDGYPGNSLSDCHWSFVLLHWEASAIKQHDAPREHAPSKASRMLGAFERIRPEVDLVSGPGLRKHHLTHPVADSLSLRRLVAPWALRCKHSRKGLCCNDGRSCRLCGRSGTRAATVQESARQLSSRLLAAKPLKHS